MPPSLHLPSALPPFLPPSPSPRLPLTLRYSDEFKYRPAASPVITEYLKDGRIRLRGATPGGVGIRKGDKGYPLSEAEKAAERQKRIDEAKEKAKAQLAEDKQRRKELRAKRDKKRKEKGRKTGEM